MLWDCQQASTVDWSAQDSTHAYIAKLLHSAIYSYAHLKELQVAKKRVVSCELHSLTVARICSSSNMNILESL